MRRIVVTGGAGFVGSHLCEALIQRGDEVVCVDDASTGCADNVGHLAGTGRFRLVEADVCDGLTLPGAVDAVFHLASPASPPAYLARPLQTLRAGSAGTEAALRLAAAKGARLVLASTSEVYGEPLVHPQPEHYRGNVDPVGPRSVYDEAKRYAEAVTAAYRRSMGVDAGIARIFNTYGPRMRPDDGRVVSSLVVAALRGEPLVLYGGGRQTRSFCYVDDLVAGLLAMGEASHPGPVNLGNDEETTIAGLAELVLELTCSSSPVVHAAGREDDPSRRRPVLELAGEVLGWRPSVPLADGLAATIAWYEAALHGAASPERLRRRDPA